MTKNLLKTILATFDMCNSTLAKEHKKMAIAILSNYNEESVLTALKRCVLEVKERLTLAHIVERIEDGRPDVHEAWKLVPKIEADSAMMTTEMLAAYGACCEFLTEGNNLGAWLAFKENYNKNISTARAKGCSVKWALSSGTDKAHRDAVIKDAVKRGLMSRERAPHLLSGNSNDTTQYTDCDTIKQLTAKMGNLK